MKKKIALIILAVLGVSSTALALDTDLFRPIGDNKGTFRIDGSRTLKPYEVSLGVFGSYMHDPLVVSGFAVAPATRAIVERQFTLTFVGDVGLHDRISLGFQVPVMATKHADFATITTYNNYWSMGDIEFHGKFRILKLEDFPVGLSIVPFVQIQTGKPQNFSGDQSVDYGALLALDRDLGRFYIGANLGFKGHYRQDNIALAGTTTSLQVANEFTYGLGGRFDIIKERLQFVTDIAGSTVIKDFFEYQRSSPIEFLGGFRAFFMDRLIGLHVGAGTGLDDGYGAPQYRVFGGLTAQFGIPHSQKVAAKRATEEETRVIILRDVFFETNSADMKDVSYPILDENVEMFKKNSDIKARIEGHCDSRNSDEYNMKLSERRANAIYKYFTDKGIPSERIIAVGMGESKPLVPNDSDENLAKNRRIELHLIETVLK